MSRIVIVDENDNRIGDKERDAVLSTDFYRVSALWVTNEKGEVLLARRAFTKSHDPGKWGPAVAGTVEAGETYLENILKEASEEIGLNDIVPKLGPKVANRGSGNKSFFCQWFTLAVPRDYSFVIQKDEVAEVRWFSAGEIKSMLENGRGELIKSSWWWPKLFNL